MKTTELRDFFTILSDLNNSFTHYTFVWNQFSLDYFDIIKKNPDTLTKIYFDSNPFSKQHNIKFKVLENEHLKTDTTLIQGIFLLLYSNYESYLKNILDFSREVKDSIKALEEKIEGVEADFMLFDKILNRLDINKSSFEIELMDTLDYLRLRRNRITHKNSINISNNLNQLIKTKGGLLNIFWDLNLPSKRQGIDFNSKENANQLNFNIIIDSINVFRRIANEIDNKVILKLTEEKIVEKIIVPKFITGQQSKINNLKSERLISKFNKFCISDYSLRINKEMIEFLKSSIA